MEPNNGLFFFTKTLASQ